MKYFFLLTIYTLANVELAFAVNATPPKIDVKLDNPIGVNSLQQFIERALQIVIDIGFPLLVLAIVYVGFLFVSARGNEEKLQTAKTAFFWVVIGAILILGSQVIVKALSGTVDQLEGGGSGSSEPLGPSNVFYDYRFDEGEL